MTTFRLASLYGAVCLALSVASPTQAQERYELGALVVTPNRTPTEPGKVGSTVHTVEREEIERRSLPLVTDYLELVPGVSTSSQGGMGRETSLIMRGADKKYVKTLFNGIDVSDVSATQVQPSLEHLLTGGVQRIEVLKGSQSTLYGSDAIAGVIGISTLPGGENGVRQRVQLEGGSHETGLATYGVSSVSDTTRIALDLAGLYTGGISAAGVNGDPSVDGSDELEDDFYRSKTASLAAEHRVDERLTLFGAGLVIDNSGNFDDSGLPPTDNTLNSGNFTQKAVRAGFDLNLMEGRLRNTLAAQVMEIDRDVSSSTVFDFGTGPVRSDFRGDFTGRRLKVDYQGAYDVADSVTLQFGADYEDQRAWISDNFGTDSDERAGIGGVWSQVVVEPIEDLTVTAGLRHDRHEDFGGFTSYRGTAAYRFAESGTKLRASVGTGFRAPSLYELNYVSFNPAVPLPDLEPEKSFSWDVGVDQSFLDGRGTASLTYFELDTDDLIDYDFVNDTYVQLSGKTERRGVELALAYEATDWLSLGGSYGYTHSEQADGERRPRVPSHQFGLLVAATPWQRWEFSASAKVALDTVDVVSPSAGTFERVGLDDYGLVRARVAYRPTDDSELYLRLDNLLDQDYETVKGYNTPGVSAFAGLKVTF